MDLFAHVGHFFFQTVEKFFDLFFADWAFFTGAPETAFQFLAIVTFARVVFFDDDEVGAFDTFKRGEAVFAFFAFAAAADFALLMGIARIQDRGFLMFAFGTDHL